LESLYDEAGKLRDGVNVRIIVRILCDACEKWLRDVDLPAVRTFAQLEVAASLAYDLIEHFSATGDSESMLKALAEYRQLRAQQNQVADRLGLNPRARKTLGHEEEESSEDEL